MNDKEIGGILYDLTRVCDERGYHRSQGLLGGEYGYGAAVETDVFMMHPFCWCERPECPWCRHCSCGYDASIYFVDGEQVDVDTYYDTPIERTSSRPIPEKQCAYCRGEVESAPNFVYKPTGATVSWHKYIGRSMRVEGDIPGDALDRCVESLSTARQIDVTSY